MLKQIVLFWLMIHLAITPSVLDKKLASSVDRISIALLTVFGRTMLSGSFLRNDLNTITKSSLNEEEQLFITYSVNYLDIYEIVA